MLTEDQFKLEVKRAQRETIEINRRVWKEDYCKNHKDCCVAPEPPLSEITPKAWFITRWQTGFIVADMQKIMKLPKRVELYLSYQSRTIVFS